MKNKTPHGVTVIAQYSPAALTGTYHWRLVAHYPETGHDWILTPWAKISGARRLRLEARRQGAEAIQRV